MIRTIAFRTRILLVSAAAALLMQPSALTAEDLTPAVLHDLAPTGVVRVAINYGDAILAQRDAATGEPRGVSAALGRALALRLRVPLKFVIYETARNVVEALDKGAWDVTFLAMDPARAATIDFTAPYVVIESGYLVPRGAPLESTDAVDRPGVRIAAGQGSASDLYLARTLKNAKLMPAPTSLAAIQLFEDEHLEAVAGVRASLAAFADTHPAYRVLPGHFMVIEQAVGTPKGRVAGVGYLKDFVEEMKASGFVHRALVESGQTGATVAPPLKR